MNEAKITAERLRAVVHYDPETGKFTRLIRLAQRHNVGDEATHATANGYQRVGIDGQRYLAHRLAWLYVYGAWPAQHIDHINGDRSDNRIANLRDVPRAVNMQNRRKPQADNKSGYLGVYWERGARKWRSRVQLAGKAYEVGLFDDPAVAHAAYVHKKRQLHEGCSI